MRLYIPCIIFGFLYQILFSSLDISDVIKILRGVGHLWFLPMLFVCFVLMRILNRYTEYDIYKILLFGFFLLPLGEIFHLPFLLYFPYMLLGYILYKKRNILKKIWRWLLPVFIILIIGKLFCIGLLVRNELLLFGLNHLINILGTITIFSACLNFKNNNDSRLLLVLNDTSYGAYIFQQFIILALLKYFQIGNLFPSIFLPWVLFIISASFSYIFSLLLLKTKYGRFLIG